MSTTLPEHFTIRPATMDDVKAVVDLLNTCSVEQIGKPHVEVHRILGEWGSPTFDLETCTRVVLTLDGKLVGYVEVWEMEPRAQRIYCWGRVHPWYKGQGLGTALIQWAEEQARQAMSKAPEGARVSLLQDTLSTDTAAQELLRKQGFRLVCYGFRLVIEMDDPPPEPVVPDGVTIRPFVRGQEERAVILALRKTFKDHWGYMEQPLEEEHQEWMHWIANDPDYDPSLWFVATDGDEIVGVSLCCLKTVEDPEMSWVNVFGVRRPWRRRGLPLALLYHTFGEFYRRGRRKVGISVGTQSPIGDIRLYRKAGMRVDRQYASYEKELRPGEDLNTQSVED
ncbi:MAG: GNAT family N-acetyltransferase [Anaerolineae bacterium]